ncbi:MAG: multisubunit Na+/H+ antiporter MnhG subunit [Lentimonas sp.]|jgi:multisubunit Na+/H+ antiporter MnhG subunit
MIASFFILVSLSIILLCAVGFLRSKSIFTLVKLIFINNIYGVSLLLLGFLLKNMSFNLAVKVFLLLTLNVIFTLIINRLIIKKAANV